ncbi:MAG: hypothetical protein KAR42_06385 [candidate division Zixibacteria bacterium]|nr:hypothetical protein [candidate division Zixibacteria bacterium]
MSELKLLSVNWQDGMLISREHLARQESYFEELTRWHALNASDCYGLVRKSHSGQGALTLNISLSGNRLRVEIVRCHAVMPNGNLIHIEGEYVVHCETDVSTTVVPVYIAIDTTVKRPHGDADPGEDMPRVPYLIHNYSVHAGKPPELAEGQYIQIARLAINGSEVILAPDYFPPCITLNADERLSIKTTDMKNRLENLVSLASRAYGAITASGTLKGESTSLQIAFVQTIGQIVYHLSSQIDSFVIGSNAGHPLAMVVYFKNMFRVISTLLNLHPGLKDYLNERFFTRELKSDIGTFLASIDSFILNEYNHRDIGGHVIAIEKTLEQFRDLMAFLAQTKKEELGEQAVATETLTYHSKTYRNLDYSNNRLERVGELNYLMIEIANPSPVTDAVILMTKALFSDGDWSNMQVRLGLNDARGLGETDPVDIDITSFGNKVALHPRDLLESSSVRQVTLIFRGAPDSSKFESLGQMDLILYSV